MHRIEKADTKSGSSKTNQILPMGKDYLFFSPGTGDAFINNDPAWGQGFLTSLRFVRNDRLFRWHREGSSGDLTGFIL